MTISGRVLVVAGSDSSGGAGIQADIKTISALGAYAATAVTAVTAQNTKGVFAVHPVPADIVAEQMTAVLDDIGADCIKIGMLGTTGIIEAVADVIETRAASMPLVVDPVMIAKGGSRLLDSAAVTTLRQKLLPMAGVLTPNIPEAEALTGFAVKTVDDMRRAAQTLRQMGPQAVYLKGGHLPGKRVVDILLTDEDEDLFEADRVETAHTHGTGCTLASAIAAGLAQGLGLAAACRRAHAFVGEAILKAPGLGGGHGPLNHLFTTRPFSD